MRHGCSDTLRTLLLYALITLAAALFVLLLFVANPGPH